MERSWGLAYTRGITYSARLSGSTRIERGREGRTRGGEREDGETSRAEDVERKVKMVEM